MALQALNWRRSLGGGETRPQLFECSDGHEWVLKLPGNPHGGNSGLSADWIGTVLGALVGLPVLQCQLIDVPVVALSTMSTPGIDTSWAKPGTAYATAHLVEALPVGGLQVLFEVATPSELSRIVVVDTWLDVLDRKKPDGRSWNLLVDSGQPTSRLRVIDYGMSLTEVIGPPLLGIPAQLVLRCPAELRPHLYAQDLREAIEDVRRVEDQAIREVVDSIPQDWLRSVPRLALVPEYLRARRDALRDLFQKEGFL